MKIGLQIYNFSWPGSPQSVGPKLVEIAQAAERSGFSSLWVMDHFFQLGGIWGAVEEPLLEGYSTMSYLAGVTQRIKLGLMVTGNIYRHPGVLIKTVTTMDVLSGGRAYLGIGTGWYRREAEGLGIPFPKSLGEATGRLEEALQIAKQMWRGDTSPFEGQYYQLAEPLNSPQPLSQPHPPILIGFNAEKVMPRLVARYADAINLHLGSRLPEYPEWLRERYRNRRDDLSRKMRIVQENCEKIGRSYDEIERTVLASIRLAADAVTPAELVELGQEMAEIGVQHIIFNMPNPYEIEPIEVIGSEVIPQVSNLG